MVKWLIPLGGAALLAWFAWFQLNTTKIAYVNGLVPYDTMPGREYILQHDAYVFVWRKAPTSGFPLLGVNHPAAATRVAALPGPDTPPPAAGWQNDEVRIVDRIPKGTRLELTSVRREESRREGTVITYEAKFLDGVERPYQKVDLRPVLLPVARGGDVPATDATVLAPWIKR
jgi:hypothetical protein